MDLEINWDTCSTAEIVQQWAENYAYDIIVYLKYYNILQIQAGMGDLLFRT